LLTSKKRYVLIGIMHSRVVHTDQAIHRTPVGPSLRALNLSLDLLTGSGAALLLISGAGSG